MIATGLFAKHEIGFEHRSGILHHGSFTCCDIYFSRTAVSFLSQGLKGTPCTPTLTNKLFTSAI